MSLLDMVSRFGRPVAAGQGDHLFWQGDKSGDFFVVQSGLLKGYYVSDEGQERIKSFILPGEVIGSLTALTGKGTCSFNLVCLEPSEMIAVSFEEVSTAAQTDAALGTAITDFLVAFGMKKEQREEGYRFHGSFRGARCTAPCYHIVLLSLCLCEFMLSPFFLLFQQNQFDYKRHICGCNIRLCFG